MKQKPCKYCKMTIKASFDREGACFSCDVNRIALTAFFLGLKGMKTGSKSNKYWIKPLEDEFKKLI